MTYKEIDRREETTVRTKVIFNFDGTEKEVDIPHFCPKNEEEIKLGIENREISEEKALKEEIVLEEKTLDAKE